MTFIWLFLCDYMMIGLIVGLPIDIPIGALFEQGTDDIQVAFKNAVFMNNNNSQAKFKLEAQIDVINTADVFKISRLICSQYSKGVFALFGLVPSESQEIFQSYSNAFHIPFISPQLLIPSPPPINYAISLRPDYTNAVLDLIEFYEWKRIIYFYDSDAGLMRLQQIFKNSKTVNNLEFHIIQRIYNVTDVTDLLVHLEKTDSEFRENKHYIILDCNQKLAKNIVIGHVSSKWLGRRNYHYLLSDLVMDDVWNASVVEFGSVNITGFRIINWKSTAVKNLYNEFKELNSNLWPQFDVGRTEASAALMFDAVNVLIKGFELLLSEDPSFFEKRTIANCSLPDKKFAIGAMLRTSLDNVTTFGLTGEIAINEEGQRKNYSLHVVKTTVDSETIKIGEWTQEKGFKYLQVELTKALAKKIKLGVANRTFIVTTIEDEPYLMMRNTSNGDEESIGNDRFYGYCKDLAEEIAKSLNLNYTFKLVNDSRFGSRNNNSPTGWDGMIGELLRKEADIAIAPLTITSNREKVVDFTKPYMTLGISIMIKKPVKQKPGVFSFMKPLSFEIWLCVTVAFLGVSFILYCVTRFSTSGFKKPDLPNHVGNDFSLYNSLWFSFAALMQQGCDVLPKCLSGRVVVSFWWFFTLIIISSYTANLAAVLTVERMVTTINSANDLAGQTEVEYGIIGHGSTEEFFKNSQNPTYQRMWMFMKERPHVFTVKNEEGVEKVRNSNGKFAFLMESVKNKYYNERSPCTTMKVGENLDTKGYGIATPQGSNLRVPLNLAVLELIESGKLEALEKKWWYDRSECSHQDTKDSRYNELTLINLAGIFYFLIGGLFLAIFVALAEFYYKIHKKNRLENNK